MRRHERLRSQLRPTAERPRLVIAISNRQVMAQIIDDKGKSLVYSTSLKLKAKGPLSQQAQAVGTDIAKRAAGHKIKKVVFDRAGRRYHGRTRALAEAARAAGLEF